jgi:hypothetical protein
MAVARFEMTGRAWEEQVIELARLYGWRVHHVRPCRRADGRWYTPVQGDPGFLDMTLVKRDTLIVAETKLDSARLTEDQRDWLAGLGQVERVLADVWRPRDLDRIAHMLRVA